MSPPTLGKGLNVALTAQQLLDHIVAHWAAAPTGSIEPLPTRRAIVPGDPRTVAWDCDQLTVSMEGIGVGQAEDQGPATSPRLGTPLSANSLRHAVLAVSLVRCSPKGPPMGLVDIDVLHAAGTSFLRDCGMLSQAVVSFAGQLQGRLQTTTPGTASVRCGAVTPFGPEGGFHGADAAIAITVPELT